MLLIFVIGGIVVVTNFSKIRENHELTYLQETAIFGYEDIALRSLDAIGKILQYQLGVSHDLEPLITNIEALDQDIDFLEKNYYSQYQIVCVRCHTQDKTEVLHQLGKAFLDIKQIIQLYKFKASMIITSPNEGLKKKLEGEILNYAETIAAIAGNLTGRVKQMKTHLKRSTAELIYRSEITLAVTFTVGSLLSLLVIIYIYRSLTHPINILTQGTEAIINGDYSQKIAVNSGDEIGVLAERFNYMASSLLKRDRALKESYARLEETNAILEASQKELEQYKEELERKVEERSEKLKEMQKHLVRCETLSAVGKMASNIFHELSSPLGTILGFSQIMLEELDQLDPKRKDLENIKQEALRCEIILKGLLGFAKAPNPLKTLININSLLKEILELIAYQPALKNIVITQHLQSDLPFVEADPEQIKQVLLNIILNAAQAMPNGGELVASTSFVRANYERPNLKEMDETQIICQTRGNGYLHISLSDTGCGIHPSHLKHIFEPFFTTKGYEQGTGLGLSISYSIIEHFGGTIQVQSRLNQGSTFTVVLPV